MIPSNRPVIGQDIDDLRLSYGLSTADACYLFGMTMGKWSLLKNSSNEPVKDASLALLVRLLDGNPSLFAPPGYPTPHEMKKLLDECQGSPIEQRMLAIMLGNDGSSAYRWLRLGAQQNPSVQRLMLYLEKALLSLPENERAEAIEMWKDIVREEGVARTGKDVLKTGRWKPENGQ